MGKGGAICTQSQWNAHLNSKVSNIGLRVASGGYEVRGHGSPDTGPDQPNPAQIVVRTLHELLQ